MSPVPVVTGLIVRDSKVLMCQRRPDKLYPLHWEFPGGKVESGETLFDALVRELREELNVECKLARQYFEDTMTYSNDVTYHVTFFLVTGILEEPVNTEFNAIGWFDVTDLSKIRQLSGNKQIIEKIIAEGIPIQ